MFRCSRAPLVLSRLPRLDRRSAADRLQPLTNWKPLHKAPRIRVAINGACSESACRDSPEISSSRRSHRISGGFIRKSNSTSASAHVFRICPKKGSMQVCIRLDDRPEQDMTGIRFGPSLRLAVPPGESYLVSHGIPGSPRDPPDHNCIRYRFGKSSRFAPWKFQDAAGKYTMDARSGPVVHALPTLYAQVAGGAGSSSRSSVDQTAPGQISPNGPPQIRGARPFHGSDIPLPANLVSADISGSPRGIRL